VPCPFPLPRLRVSSGTTRGAALLIAPREKTKIIIPNECAVKPVRHAVSPRSADDNGRMDVTAKLQIKPGQRVAALAAGGDVPCVVTPDANPAADPGAADAVVAFARNRAELDSVAAPAIEAARLDKLAWIAYPKAGKLGTDLNRDILAALLTERGVQPVRQVAIDDTWSALRFRPA
jgi:hypothetical protein